MGHEYIGTWIHGDMDTWVNVCMGTCVHGDMETCVHGYLNLLTLHTAVRLGGQTGARVPEWALQADVCSHGRTLLAPDEVPAHQRGVVGGVEGLKGCGIDHIVGQGYILPPKLTHAILHHQVQLHVQDVGLLLEYMYQHKCVAYGLQELQADSPN